MTLALAMAVLTSSSAATGGCQPLVPYNETDRITPAERVAQILADHTQLRMSLNGIVPHAKTMVLVMLSQAHYSTTRLSFIATRGAAAHWTVSRIGTTTYGVPEIPPEKEEGSNRPLTRDQGIALDALIADPCLYRQPFMIEDYRIPPMNAWQTSIAVITPKQVYSGQAFGPVPATAGKIVTAITGW